MPLLLTCDVEQMRADGMHSVVASQREIDLRRGKLAGERPLRRGPCRRRRGG